MPPHPLTNIEIQKYYQNEPRFNVVFSRDNLPKKIKDGTYVIKLDKYADVGTHWNALLIANIFRVQSNNPILCRYFCIGFIDFMLAGKRLTDFTSMFSPYDFEKSDSTTLNYFKDE